MQARDLHLRDFGGKADGKTDDGSAILKMVETARAMKGKPVRLVFPQNKVIHAATGNERYLFALQHTPKTSPSMVAAPPFCWIPIFA